MQIKTIPCDGEHFNIQMLSLKVFILTKNDNNK